MSNTPLNVITANRLAEGNIVYLILEEGRGQWTTDLANATIFTDETLAQGQSVAANDMAHNTIVDAYVVSVDQDKNPLSQREKIRAGGPTQPYGKDA
ncbi:MAG: hypothetical protein CMF31_01630 [Kordiimonas sp.]|nr:hypothetical protein [Kordiimonas sp.]|tara:strand:+ start:1768 stop:2058 length:291 start_codon:yes stop_codon:yes gene_type:complete